MNRLIGLCVMLLAAGCGESQEPGARPGSQRVSDSDARAPLSRPAQEPRRVVSRLENATRVTSPFGFELLVPRGWVRSARGGQIVFEAPGAGSKLSTLAIQVSPYENEATLELIEQRLFARGARQSKLGGVSGLRLDWLAERPDRAWAR